MLSISIALFALVPRRMIRAVRLPSPPLPAGSAMPPARVARATETFGSSGRSTTKTSRPFGSLDDFTSGAVNGRSVPSGGSLVRSTAVVDGAPDGSGRKRTISRLRVLRYSLTTALTLATVAPR